MIDQQKIVPTITIVEEAMFVSDKQLVFMYLYRFRELLIFTPIDIFWPKKTKNSVGDAPVRGNAF